MPRNRTISPDFWTTEAVVDCAPMTRLLFLGLWNFADDGGVQPLRPSTIRLQVFPGDPLDDAQLRAMIDELVARKLARIFEVGGQEYLAIVNWEQIQTVGKSARRRYPSDPVERKRAPDEEGISDATRKAVWREFVGKMLQKLWPGGPPADTATWVARWMAEGYSLENEVMPAIAEVCKPAVDRDPPTALHEVATALAVNRARRASGSAAAMSMGSRTVHAAA